MSSGTGRRSRPPRVSFVRARCPFCGTVQDVVGPPAGESAAKPICSSCGRMFLVTVRGKLRKRIRVFPL